MNFSVNITIHNGISLLVCYLQVINSVEEISGNRETAS